MSTQLVVQDELARDEQFHCDELVLSDFERVAAIEPLCYSNPWSREVLYNEFYKEVSLRVGLRVEGRLVGYSFNHRVLDELHVLNLAIDPEYRGRGGGAQLLWGTLERGLRAGAQRAFLEVRPSNSAALALYQKFGFRHLGVRKCYYRDNGEDALVMEAFLTKALIQQFDRSCVKC